MKHRVHIFLLLALALLGACSEDGDPLPMEPPPPTDVHFARDILPIFTGRCAAAGCHVSPAPKAGLDMSVDSCYANLVNTPTEVFTPGIRVIPFDPDQSVLYMLVRDGRMPDQGPPLSKLQVQKIRKWIEDGALND